MNMSNTLLCRGYTLKKEKCKRKAIKDGYCNAHKDQKDEYDSITLKLASLDIEKEYKTENCAICLEKLEGELPIQCGHIFHVICLKQLRAQNCPVCKVFLNKLPSEIIKSIQSCRGKREVFSAPTTITDNTNPSEDFRRRARASILNTLKPDVSQKLQEFVQETGVDLLDPSIDMDSMMATFNTQFGRRNEHINFNFHRQEWDPVHRRIINIL